MRLLESIGLAVSAIKANKMRSFLTMLGIIIGISSVITISTIGATAKGLIEDLVSSNGMKYLYLQVNWEVAGDYVMEDDLIRKDEADMLKERMGEELVYYAPYVNMSAAARTGKKEADMNILGVAEKYDLCRTDVSVVKGRFINKTDVERCRPVLVIPDSSVEYFFGDKDPIGRTLQVIYADELEEYTVVGVYHKDVSTLEGLLGGNSKYQAFAPYSIDGLDYQAYYLECYVSSEDSVEAGDRMASLLTKIKKKEPGYYRADADESNLSMITQVLDIVSLAIGAIAAISLIVGGIGIMNIMLVSVTERTREIGIRKALGARTGDILWQFLVESMILSVFGGLIGILMGIGVAWIAAEVLGAKLIVEVRTIVIAVIFSGAVGMIFGLFPARKAARKDPIEALRYE